MDGFHSLGIGNHIGRDITLIKLHAFNQFFGHLGRLRFLHGNHAVFADFFENIGNKLSQFRVIGRNRSDFFYFFVTGNGFLFLI